ncbi:histone-lysine N-methyltransferase 2B-like [Chiloscyllium punctatum]|uniref:histone-lysine N-methyltransferase 2B-like n=1 Tax=Chiloscyllium punctatum TaxID=137246 RepID=UPI003B637335
MRCEYCQKPGATVGCCLSSCQSNYHFMCARACKCVFEEDKKVYCQRHKDLVEGKTVLEDGFEVMRRTFVDFEGITLRRKFLTGLEPENVNMIIGSMTIDSLGILTELSECEGHIFPVGYQCSRVYWSTFNARRKCVYRCKIMEYHPPASETDLNSLDQGTNHTIVHSPSTTEVNDAMDPAGKGQEEQPHSPEGQKARPLPPPRPFPSSRIKTPSYPSGCRWSSGGSRPLPSPGSPASVSHHILTVSDPAISPQPPLCRSQTPQPDSPPHGTQGMVTSPPRPARTPAPLVRTKDGAPSLPHRDAAERKTEGVCTRPRVAPTLPGAEQRNGLEREPLGEPREGSGSRRALPGDAGRQQHSSTLGPKILETLGQFGVRRVEAPGQRREEEEEEEKGALELPCPPLSAAELLAPGSMFEGGGQRGRPLAAGGRGAPLRRHRPGHCVSAELAQPAGVRGSGRLPCAPSGRAGGDPAAGSGRPREEGAPARRGAPARARRRTRRTRTTTWITTTTLPARW